MDGPTPNEQELAKLIQFHAYMSEIAGSPYDQALTAKEWLAKAKSEIEQRIIECAKALEDQRTRGY